MKKGLKLTLMTVAVAALGMNAMAMAPVIGNVPSPVVGNDGAATEPNRFVFPDAIDLNTMASDDTTAADQIKWSFYIAGTPKYKINGVDSLTGTEVAASTGINPTTPGAKEIARQVLGGEKNDDAKSNTITIRNNDLSPLGASGTKTPAAGVQDVQTVSFFASDGTTASLPKDVFFYTDNGGADRMSGGIEVPVANFTFTTGAEGWNFVQESYSGAMSPSSNTGALTMNIGMTGAYVGTWKSPFPAFQLSADSVYKIRMKLNFTQAQTGANVPLWDLQIDNWSDTSQGMNLYGADYQVLDMPGEGSAYAIPTNAAGTDFVVYWAPAPTDNANWKSTSTGIFTPAMDAKNDVRLQLRGLDVSGNATTTGDLDGGTISLMELEVTKFPTSKITATAAPEVKDFTSANYSMTSFNGLTPTWDNTAKTLLYTPNAGAASGEMVQIFPGDAANAPGTDNITDNYIIPWTAGTLYRLSVDMKAPTADDVKKAPDFYQLSIKNATQENNLDAFVTNVGDRVGMPQTTKGTFSLYYYANFATKSTTAAFKKLEPVVVIGNNNNWNDVGSANDKTNMGKVEFSNFKVETIEFK